MRNSVDSFQIISKKQIQNEFKVPEGIPEWVAQYPDYFKAYEKRDVRSRVPIFDIVSKSILVREPQENQFVGDWLEKLDVFS